LKQRIYKLYGFFHSLKYPSVLKETLSSMIGEEVYDNKTHLQLSVNWLLNMQNSDGGYARKFSFVSGEDMSYIETTGYIIPSLWSAGERLNEIKYINSAKKAGEWLLKIQNDDGSFSEIDSNTPFAFDTGQCLIGLNFLYQKTEHKEYLDAAKRAAYWLMQNQEEDGSWQKVAYNTQKHTYYSRVAAAMLHYAVISNDYVVEKVAMKHIAWVLSEQKENGFFQKSSFLEDVAPYLHTIIYVLEGLLDIYDLTNDKVILEAVLKNANVFKEISLKRDLILCSQYDENFNCVNKERCITGLAQWAGVALRLFEITDNEEYLQCAKNTLFYLKAKQIKSSVMRGGFSASVPFLGKYGSFDFVNWSNKFFIDTLLKYDNFYISSTDEQESFVATAFMQTNDVVTDSLSIMDKQYLKELKAIFPKDKPLRVLDIGCGKGIIMDELSKEFKNIEFFGVDPVYESKTIKKGSVYKIPFENEYFDVVMSFEVLQHTYINRALQEIQRVLKYKGEIIIGERNPFSLLGFLKPILELKGKWMYPWDSPFREKWYNENKWVEILRENGFETMDFKSIEGAGKRFMNRYFLIKGESK